MSWASSILKMLIKSAYAFVGP